MRMLLRAHLEVEAANLAIRDGSLARLVERVVARAAPEAVYFLVESGRRTVLMVFDMADPSMIPELAEPLFQELGAEIGFVPVMVAAELQAGLGAWAAAA